MTKFNKAYLLAEKAHKGQMRKDGVTPYFSHPVEVTSQLSQYLDDQDLLSTSILHDVIEDTDITEDELRILFGDKVTRDVILLSHNYSSNKDEYFAKMEGKIDVVLVKFSDRLHNLSTLEHLTEEKQRKNVIETKKYFGKLKESVSGNEYCSKKKKAVNSLYLKIENILITYKHLLD